MHVHEPEEVKIHTDSVELAGTLQSPPKPRGVVVFAHGSGSSRFGARNRAVAAAALRAAVELGPLVRAVVSRGGRPDLAASALPLVQAPTLLIVGGADTEVLALNRDAKDVLPAAAAP